MFLSQFSFNLSLFALNFLGLILNQKNVLISIMCIELVLLSINLNFILFSVYLYDFYGQVFSLFILTVAAAESSIGLALIISYFRIRGTILMNQSLTIRY